MNAIKTAVLTPTPARSRPVTELKHHQHRQLFHLVILSPVHGTLLFITDHSKKLPVLSHALCQSAFHASFSTIVLVVRCRTLYVAAGAAIMTEEGVGNANATQNSQQDTVLLLFVPFLVQNECECLDTPSRNPPCLCQFDRTSSWSRQLLMSAPIWPPPSFFVFTPLFSFLLNVLQTNDATKA